MNYTNFNGYDHGKLRDMVQSMNSGEVMAASDPWRRAADTLKAIHSSLGTASGDAAVDWEGATSDAFYTKMTKLANSINNTASYAQDAAETLRHTAEAIDLAKRTMPEEPGLWDQVTDAVGDTASAAVGGDDEDTKTAIKGEKKAQAVAVMQTLAMKYRVAAEVLSPSRMPTTTSRPGRDDVIDVPPPADPTGAAAIGGLIAGAGLGLGGSVGGSAGSGDSTSGGRSSGATTQQSPKSTGVQPTMDPGIQGGTAQAAPKVLPAGFGSGTGLDGVTLTTPPGGSGTGFSGVTGGGGGTSATGGAGFSGGGGAAHGFGGVGIGFGGKGSGSATGEAGAFGSGQNKAGTAGKGLGRAGAGAGGGRGGSAFGAGGMGEGGLGSGGRGGAGGRAGAGGRTGGGLARQAGGVVGESGRGGAGGSSRKAFTEGGSGLGARGRVQGEQGQGAHGKGAGQGVPSGDARRKKDKENGGRRPDYLVEDEETWVSGEASNPNVVE